MAATATATATHQTTATRFQQQQQEQQAQQASQRHVPQRALRLANSNCYLLHEQLMNKRQDQPKISCADLGSIRSVKKTKVQSSSVPVMNVVEKSMQSFATRSRLQSLRCNLVARDGIEQDDDDDDDGPDDEHDANGNNTKKTAIVAPKCFSRAQTQLATTPNKTPTIKSLVSDSGDSTGAVILRLQRHLQGPESSLSDATSRRRGNRIRRCCSDKSFTEDDDDDYDEDSDVGEASGASEGDITNEDASSTSVLHTMPTSSGVHGEDQRPRLSKGGCLPLASSSSTTTTTTSIGRVASSMQSASALSLSGDPGDDSICCSNGNNDNKRQQLATSRRHRHRQSSSKKKTSLDCDINDSGQSSPSNHNHRQQEISCARVVSAAGNSRHQYSASTNTPIVTSTSTSASLSSSSCLSSPSLESSAATPPSDSNNCVPNNRTVAAATAAAQQVPQQATGAQQQVASEFKHQQALNSLTRPHQSASERLIGRRSSTLDSALFSTSCTRAQPIDQEQQVTQQSDCAVPKRHTTNQSLQQQRRKPSSIEEQLRRLLEIGNCCDSNNNDTTHVTSDSPSSQLLGYRSLHHLSGAPVASAASKCNTWLANPAPTDDSSGSNMNHYQSGKLGAGRDNDNDRNNGNNSYGYNQSSGKQFQQQTNSSSNKRQMSSTSSSFSPDERMALFMSASRRTSAAIDSTVERNARILKWLHNCRSAT